MKVNAEKLKRFCARVFQSLDVSEQDAWIAADVLVAADLRGVDSHGVARFRPYYVDGLRNGTIVARPRFQIVTETPATAVLDAGAGLGQVASYRAMESAIHKARDCGAGFVAVRNSNHYGIAGYYAMMALKHDCVGISMTNSEALVAPTFGSGAALGTNPIAVAAPAGHERPFVLDMATSIVALGKLEVYNRREKIIPLGWAMDETGVPSTDVVRVLENLKGHVGGALLALGGAGELLGGHKGYGLALWVEIFTALLSGTGSIGQDNPSSCSEEPADFPISHFFGAWRINGFRPVSEFKAAMDDLQRRLKNAPKAKGQPRIYIHGEKEYEEADRRARQGIPLNPKVEADLRNLAQEFGLAFDVAQD